MDEQFIGSLPQWISAVVAVLVLFERSPSHTRRKLAAALIWLIPFALLVYIFHVLGLAAWMAVLAVSSSGLLGVGLVKYYPTLRKHTFNLLFHDEQ